MSFNGTVNIPVSDHTLKDNAPSGYVRFMVGLDGVLRTKDSSGNITVYATGISPEEVQDIVGQFIADSASIDATYDDNGNILSFVVNQSSIDHGNLSNLLADHHTQYLNNVRGDARYYTKTINDNLLAQKQDVSSLGSSVLALLLTGFTIGTSAVISATDSILEAFRKIQAQINAKEPIITAGTISQYWRGDKTWQAHDKASIGLGSVDNTSDASKPISTLTQTALNAKENLITIGTTSQYWRGDKSFQTLDKASVGLPLVDNTSDLSKPISTATQTALNAKEPTLVNPLDTSKYYRGDKTWATHDKISVGLSNVDNTSDLNKPISTASQSALNLKYDNTNPSGFETPAQLNARDTANRSRANHTGSQLSSTISDFTSTVRSTALTGLSFATIAGILATDTMLEAFGKIQALFNDHVVDGNGHSEATTSTRGFMSALDKVKLDGIISEVISFVSVALTNISNVTFVTVTELQIPVVSGKRYKFKAHILFDSNATTTGITLSIGGTATGTLRANSEAPISNTAGTANKISGPINAINGAVTTTGVGAVGTQYCAEIEGVFTATSNGLIYPQFRSEVNGTQVRVNIDSNIVYKEY